MSLKEQYPDLTLDWKPTKTGWICEVGEPGKIGWRQCEICECGSKPGRYIVSCLVNCTIDHPLADSRNAGDHTEYNALLRGETFLKEKCTHKNTSAVGEHYTPGQPLKPGVHKGGPSQ